MQYPYFFGPVMMKSRYPIFQPSSLLQPNTFLCPIKPLFYARGFDKDGNRIDKIDVEWSSSNPSIASISNEGEAKALSHGIATISAVSNGISASKELAVTSTRRKILSEMFTSST